VLLLLRQPWEPEPKSLPHDKGWTGTGTAISDSDSASLALVHDWMDMIPYPACWTLDQSVEEVPSVAPFVVVVEVLEAAADAAAEGEEPLL
jgi:hypothetical protein